MTTDKQQLRDVATKLRSMARMTELETLTLGTPIADVYRQLADTVSAVAARLDGPAKPVETDIANEMDSDVSTYNIQTTFTNGGGTCVNKFTGTLKKALQEAQEYSRLNSVGASIVLATDTSHPLRVFRNGQRAEQ
jgi:hypothetical protein